MKTLDKIKSFFRRFFSNQKKLPEAKCEMKDIKDEEDFMETLQKDAKNYANKNKILEEINNNPNLIYSLSYPRLLQLNQLYEEKISELEKKIKIERQNLQ